ncbi:hypothetical protein TNCV_595221 [Trichonephila clavipes]|nr:hypothetical protein TNCV_595221 [Trichonephila clavipes]
MSSDDTASYPVEFLSSLDLSGVPSHKLELKPLATALSSKRADEDVARDVKSCPRSVRDQRFMVARTSSACLSKPIGQ